MGNRENTKSVLIVDDDREIVRTIKESVNWNKAGISEIRTAFNISQAKAILLENPMDIVISDIEMPQGSGIDLLEWMRDRGEESEFLLLTCHENFSYASHAIRFNVAEYLVKPFDCVIMEAALKKIMLKIKEKEALYESSKSGKWFEENVRKNHVAFWRDFFNGHSDGGRKKIEEEITGRRLKISMEDSFRIVMTRIVDDEQAESRLGRAMLDFILEGFHSELLNLEIENKNTYYDRTESGLLFVTVCAETEEASLRDKCRQLMDACKNHMGMILTVCISREYSIEELPEAKNKLERLITESVSYYGTVFGEMEVTAGRLESSSFLDMEKVDTLLREKDKNGLLRYVKDILTDATRKKTLNEHMLYLLSQEILQSVYAYLLRKGIQATRLFYDDISAKLNRKASQSSVDMLRWVSYLMNRMFAYEEELKESSSMIGRINEYIQNHYAEHISRNEIAGEFYLTPEYLAKLYKKKTGKNIKDYINEVRIDRAKEFLDGSDYRISDVAELSGFDNFSYFSTIFKKYTGMSPKEYKHRNSS